MVLLKLFYDTHPLSFFGAGSSADLSRTASQSVGGFPRERNETVKLRIVSMII